MAIPSLDPTKSVIAKKRDCFVAPLLAMTVGLIVIARLPVREAVAISYSLSK